MKPLVLNKKEATRVFTEFVNAPRKQKSKMWDTVVPYANKYRDLYLKIVCMKEKGGK